MAVTSLASSTTSALALAEGNGRNAVLLSNSDANACYILLERGTASASNMSIQLAAGECAKLPVEFANHAVTAVWATDGSGYLHITTV